MRSLAMGPSPCRLSDPPSKNHTARIGRNSRFPNLSILRCESILLQFRFFFWGFVYPMINSPCLISCKRLRNVSFYSLHFLSSFIPVFSFVNFAILISPLIAFRFRKSPGIAFNSIRHSAFAFDFQFLLDHSTFSLDPPFPFHGKC